MLGVLGAAAWVGAQAAALEEKRASPVVEERVCNMSKYEEATIASAVLRGSERKFLSCAVVGSGGKLLGSGLGGEIDAHDFVVRHNNAPTAGFEGDVGSKTTMLIQSSTALKDLMDRDKVGKFQCPAPDQLTFYTSHISELRAWLPKRCANDTSQFIDLRDYIIQERLSASIRSQSGDLMAGPTAILVALRVCEAPIDLYGFTVGKITKNNKLNTPYHYYDDVTPVLKDGFDHVANKLERFIRHTVPGCINVRT